TDSNKEEDAEQDVDPHIKLAKAAATTAAASAVPTGGSYEADIPPSSSIPSDEFAGGSDVPAGATTGPSADPSNKGKSPLLEEDPPVRERTFRQREEDKLDSDWTDIMGQVHANQGLTADLLGPDVTEDNFVERMVALIAKRRRDFAAQRFQDKMNQPMTYAQQKAYMRTFVKNRSSTIYTTGWTMKHVKSFFDDQLKTEFDKIRTAAVELQSLNIRVSLKRPAAELQSLNKLVPFIHKGTLMGLQRWPHVLASFDKGGLAIGSLKAFNLTFLHKLRWRFFINPGSLWVKVIRALHGSEGGFDQNGCSPISSVSLLEESKFQRFLVPLAIVMSSPMSISSSSALLLKRFGRPLGGGLATLSLFLILTLTGSNGWLRGDGSDDVVMTAPIVFDASVYALGGVVRSFDCVGFFSRRGGWLLVLGGEGDGRGLYGVSLLFVGCWIGGALGCWGFARCTMGWYLGVGGLRARGESYLRLSEKLNRSLWGNGEPQSTTSPSNHHKFTQGLPLSDLHNFPNQNNSSKLFSIEISLYFRKEKGEVRDALARFHSIFKILVLGRLRVVSSLALVQRKDEMRRKRLRSRGGESFWEECNDFGVDVLRFHTCLTDILGFLEKLEWWFEQDIDDEGEEDEEDGGEEDAKDGLAKQGSASLML
ncbi:hypothetical protein Tco_0412957, partial [Tanacetum coccineum]